MTSEEIARINELARKSKREGLTEEERAEQKALRDAYRAACRANLEDTLSHTVVVNERGEVIKPAGEPGKKT